MIDAAEPCLLIVVVSLMVVVPVTVQISTDRPGFGVQCYQFPVGLRLLQVTGFSLAIEPANLITL